MVFAAKFVEMSLNQQRSSVHPVGDGEPSERSYKLEVTEFHPKQSAAFDCACNLLGTYFSDEQKRLRTEAERWEPVDMSEDAVVGGYE